MSKFTYIKFLSNLLNGTYKATKQWNAQAGKLAIRKPAIPFVRSRPVIDNTYAWVRKADRQATLAGRQAYSQATKDIPEAAKIYSKSGRSFTIDPQYHTILNWNRQAAYNAVRDKAIADRAAQIRNQRYTPIINFKNDAINGVYNFVKKHPYASAGAVSVAATIPGFRNFLQNQYLDNLFPYGYTDNPTKPVTGGIKKVMSGFLGKSEGRKAVDEFVNLDLSNPQDMQRAEELYKNSLISKWFVNTKSLPSIQRQLKARLDAISLYTGKPQRYGSWVENKDYQSPTAQAHGVPTYTYADPELRAEQMKNVQRFNNSSKAQDGVNPVVNDILNTFNNYSTVKGDSTDRYIDDWDFIVNIPGHQKVIFADEAPRNDNIQGETYITSPTDPTDGLGHTILKTIEKLKHL